LRQPTGSILVRGGLSGRGFLLRITTPGQPAGKSGTGRKTQREKSAARGGAGVHEDTPLSPFQLKML